jgi:hypothetical protein
MEGGGLAGHAHSASGLIGQDYPPPVLSY